MRKKISEATIEDFSNPEIEFEWVHGAMVEMPMSVIVKNDWNYNELSPETFNALMANITEVDFIDPATVVPILPKEEGKCYLFRIVDGEHRVEAARLDDRTIVKAVIADPAIFDEKQQMLQTARLNHIKGVPNKMKFRKFVEKLMTDHEISMEEMAEKLGIVDEGEFQALLDEVRNGLPDGAKEEFDKTRKEIKTVDDLSMVLNLLFTKYGNTLPYHFMVMDFGGKKHLWVRCKGNQYSMVLAKAKQCLGKDVTFDSVIMALLEATNLESFIESHKEELDAPDESQMESIEEMFDGE